MFIRYAPETMVHEKWSE